jgi:thiosulfate reductase cytochrome b subunit
MIEDQHHRHAAMVRVTHWIHTIAFFALLISGAAILVAHPRLYWGETGGYGSPALIELPLPLNTDQSGWGRSLHFLAAWLAVGNGSLYVLSGIWRGHFRSNSKSDMMQYTALQRHAYLAVIFVLLPLMIATGLAMSPAVASVVPLLPGIFGGHQSSRTVHFFTAVLLTAFLIIHVAKVYSAGFGDRMRSMITGSGV